MIKINLNTIDAKIPLDTIGVDMGQSLSKTAILEDDILNFSYFLTQSESLALEEALKSRINHYKKINFTGGKSFGLFQIYSNKIETKLINEFEANTKGVEILHLLEKGKELPSSLIVTIGTGTSMVSKKVSIEHLGGSAMGGGFFMGLLRTLFNITDFQEAMNLAKKGNRYNVDLKVSDIYNPEDNRVDLLFREFTAASLGKVDVNYNMNNLKKEDFINSLICLIGENIGTIANLMADTNDLSTIVFCGGFLRENKIAQKILSLMCRVNKKKAIFLKNSEFCAAIGALFL
jgi:type II pantothenate kinase